jgi:Domain of unknown function (DUF3859)
MRKLVLVLCWWLIAAGTAAAQAPTIIGVTITNAGPYTAESKSAPARSGQQSPTSTVGTVRNWRFTSDSHDVLGKVGAQFGMEFRIDGAPPGENVTLYFAVQFPAEGIRNPNTGVIMHDAKIALPNMKIGALCLVGYGFDNEWEIAPGSWTLQIWYQDQMLAAQSFTVGKVE